MTALKKYTRLEASGLWKESKKAGFIEILISIGKTSVILSDYNDNPLTHWSLAAIKLVSQNPNEAMFSTDLDNGEILLIKDSHMIEALLLFINRDPQKPRNNKVFIKTCVSLLVILLTTFILYFPSKIKELVASVISKQHERQIIAPFLHTHIESSGGICTSKKTDEISRKIVNLVDKTNSFISFSIIRNQKLNVFTGFFMFSNLVFTGIIFASLSAMLGGGGLVFTRLALPQTDAFTLSFLRWFILAVILFLIYWRQLNFSKMGKLDRFQISLLGLIYFAGFPILLTLGLTFTTAGRAGIIFATMPIWTLVISSIFQIEAITKSSYLQYLLQFSEYLLH